MKEFVVLLMLVGVIITVCCPNPDVISWILLLLVVTLLCINYQNLFVVDRSKKLSKERFLRILYRDVDLHRQKILRIYADFPYIVEVYRHQDFYERLHPNWIYVSYQIQPCFDCKLLVSSQDGIETIKDSFISDIEELFNLLKFVDIQDRSDCEYCLRQVYDSFFTDCAAQIKKMKKIKCYLES